MVTSLDDETGGVWKLPISTFKRRQSRPLRRSPSQVPGLWSEGEARFTVVHSRARYINCRYKIACLIYMYVFPFTGTNLHFTGTETNFRDHGENSSYLGLVDANLNGTKTFHIDVVDVNLDEAGVIWKVSLCSFKRSRSHSNWRWPRQDMNCFCQGPEI